MPVSGLVITLASTADRGQAATTALGRCPGLELGVREGNRIAAVLTAATERENKLMWQWLNGLPGVDHVDVVFVSMEPGSDDAGTGQAAGMTEVCHG